MNPHFTFLIAAFASSILALMLYRLPFIQKIGVFVLIGISGLTAICSGIAILLSPPTINLTINLTLPNLASQITIDPLSGFFLIIIGIIVSCVSFYGPEYINKYSKHGSPTTIYFFTGLFISGMYLVVIAYDVFTFMLAWELMSISSYFLVIHNHEQTNNRYAALVYLLMAQASGLLILFAFSTLIKATNSYYFTVWQGINLAVNVRHLAFIFAFLGFGMKAGIVPLHIWLPKAHPVAPSHISALMSGVMLKVAIYGFIRFTFTILRHIHLEWGAITLLIGTISALVGVLYALMQHDLKKLLAYCSIENIGIIYCALGLSMIFISTGHPLLAALSLTASLYHCLNHALFKSLLFFGAGAIANFCHEHDIEHLGGLIKKMPHTAWYFLIGCISISALPPFNGFISEWLFLQASLQSSILASEVMRIMIIVAAAIITLTSALAAACFVKVYGITFLGQPRSLQVNNASDPKFSMKLAMGTLAFLCLLSGIFPTTIITFLNVVSRSLINAELLSAQNWLWLMPITTRDSTYSGFLISIGFIITILTVYLLIRICFGRTKMPKAYPWDCGFGNINPRMQYSATAFAMPIRRIFAAFFLSEEKIEKTNNSTNYFLQTKDLFLHYIYTPLGHFSFLLTKKVARLQGGNVRVYLTYIFITLILLLWLTTQLG